MSKEYVFIGNAQNKTRDYIKQIEKENMDKDKEIELCNICLTQIENEVERLHSIIKEVREDIKYCIPVLEQEEEMSTDERSRKETGELKEILQKRLEILDKENK